MNTYFQGGIQGGVPGTPPPPPFHHVTILFCARPCFQMADKDDSAERVGLLSHAISKEDLNREDHIYCNRTLAAYRHHGIYVGKENSFHYRPRYVRSSSDEVHAGRVLWWGPAALSSIQPVHPTGSAQKRGHLSHH